jgi:enoyl-CoA hydratase/carnithine racemase
VSAGIAVTRRGSVVGIGFDRPHKRNALTAAMYAAMAEELARVEADDAARVVLFHGSREAFTAGNDLEDFRERPPSGEDAPVFRFLTAISGSTRPLVAAVNGPAIGLGTTLLLHCDLVYAAQDARFSMPFTQLGVVPEFASSYLLPLIAGYQRAAELLLLGEPFDADRARNAGFVTAVLPPDQVLDAAWAAAEKLARLPKEPVRLTRALLKSAHRDAIERQLRSEGQHFRRLLKEPAAREALAAFLEKRKPDFTDK